jgi:hypothetical protein
MREVVYRSRKVDVRLTPEEDDAVTDSARTLGISKSDFIRACLQVPRAGKLGGKHPSPGHERQPVR